MHSEKCYSHASKCSQQEAQPIVIRYFKVAIPLQLITSPAQLQGETTAVRYQCATEVGERSTARNNSGVSRAMAIHCCKDWETKQTQSDCGLSVLSRQAQSVHEDRKLLIQPLGQGMKIGSRGLHVCGQWSSSIQAQRFGECNHSWSESGLQHHSVQQACQDSPSPRTPSPSSCICSLHKTTPSFLLTVKLSDSELPWGTSEHTWPPLGGIRLPAVSAPPFDDHAVSAAGSSLPKL